MSASWQIIVGDCRDRLAELPERSVHTVVTSPPYFGLRDYGTADWDGGDAACDHTPARPPRHGRPRGGLTGGTATIDAQDAGAVPYRDRCGKCGATRVDRQIGLEPTPDDFVDALVAVFREVRRVLRDDGTAWLNLGDSYAANRSYQVGQSKHPTLDYGESNATVVPPGCKPKDLIGIPWLVAFALRADGWYLRSEVIWHKPNPMPESITDRPTKAHEHVFLLSKAPRYYYDADAIREPQDTLGERHEGRSGYRDGHPTKNGGYVGLERQLHPLGRNKRDVWTVATQPYAGAHFATFPAKLVEPCVLAGCPEGGTVLDPFSGAGTTGLVALRNGRSYIGLELNPEYAELARDRIRDDAPLFNTPAEVAA